MKLDIDSARLQREIDRLAAFSDAPAPAVTRIVFSGQDLAARAWLKTRCAEAGLALREDAVGNVFARWVGKDDSLPAVASGSHIDAIPHSGRYDGTVGVLGALEAIRSLRHGGFEPVRSIELILFTSEEPTRFGIGCLGSRLMSGTLASSADEALKDADGNSLQQVRTQAGFTGTLQSVRLARGHYHAFVELHIEQGPQLEKRGVPLGVVTAIAAPASLRIHIEGEGGHAGAVLMPHRRDAFLAAAEIALAIEAAAKSTGAADSVGTTGVCQIFPSAINSIPSRVRLEADIRDTNLERRDGMLAKLDQACGEVSARRRVQVAIETINRDAPATCDVNLVSTLSRACAAAGSAFDLMVSRAYHDSLFISRIAPVSMLFIPCRNGVSHTPEEYASPEAMALGTLTLAHGLAELASA